MNELLSVLHCPVDSVRPSSPGRAELRGAAMLSVLSVDLFITLLFDYNLLTQQQ